jgi:hypothetical protein
VLAAVSVASATAAPHLQGYLDMAHQTKAIGDLRVIAVSIIRLTNDVGRVGPSPASRPALLVGPGNVPEATGPETQPWTGAIDDRATQTLEGHLVTNGAGYDPARWRGPYVESMTADPWGSRYSSNVGVLLSGRNDAVIVVSPGPNRIIETPFAQVGLRTGGDDLVSVIGRGQ